MSDVAPPSADAPPSAAAQTGRTTGAPRLLFVPVSGAFGMGEYARSLAIALAAQARWPGAAIHFILSRAAPYAGSVPFPATLLDSSATFHSAAVIEFMAAWRPDIVVFDSAGRTAQLRAAQRLGARVVYISARRKQRRKAFRGRWMRLIAEHWIAYPAFIAGEPGCAERLKMRWFGRPTLRYLDVIMARHAGRPDRPETVPAQHLEFDSSDYLLLVPGGGTAHPGAHDAVEIFVEAARILASAGINVVCVGRTADPHAADKRPVGSRPAASRLRMLGAMAQAELGDFLRGARLVVANGGSTLLQAIACARPCLAVPIAGDQAGRIRLCVAAGIAVAAPLDAAAIVTAARQLWDDAPRREVLAARAAALGLADGVDIAVRALAGLLAK